VAAAAAAAAGEDPQGMHPNQMPGNLNKRKNINPLSAYLTHSVNCDNCPLGAYMPY